jgi:hypothetical protein
MTAAELAEKVGVHETRIYSVERWERNRPETVDALAKITGISAEVLAPQGCLLPDNGRPKRKADGSG